MSPDPDSCRSIFASQDPLQDPCLRFNVSASLYLRSFCKIHVSDSCLSILIIRFCGPAQAKRKFWPPETRFVWPCAGKTVRPRSAVAFRAGETQTLTSGDAFCVAPRRENSPTECFAQAKRKFWPAETHFLWPCAGETQIWPPETRLVPISCGFTRSHDQMNENRHGATARRRNNFRPFWLPEARFLWPCAGKTAEARNLHLDLRGFTPTVRTPQCATLFGESNRLSKRHHSRDPPSESFMATKCIKTL